MESGCHLPWRRLWKQIHTRADSLVLILGSQCMRRGPSLEPDEGSSRTSPPSRQLPVRLYLGKSLKTHVIIVKPTSGTSLVVQWLRLHASNAEGMGSIPAGGTKIPTCLKSKKWIIKHSFVNFPQSLVSQYRWSLGRSMSPHKWTFCPWASWGDCSWISCTTPPDADSQGYWCLVWSGPLALKASASCVLIQQTLLEDFSRGPVVKTLHSHLQGAQVQSLVGELRSHMLQDGAVTEESLDFRCSWQVFSTLFTF